MIQPPDSKMTLPRPLRARSLSALPWLRHSFSTRSGGVTSVYGRPSDLNLGFTPSDSTANVLENRRRLGEVANPAGQCWPIATLRQTHSSTVQVIAPATSISEEGDALVTATPSLFLGILTADCVPILIADTRLRLAAATHAGWRGTAARIAELTVHTMHEHFGSAPEDLLAAIGPSIGPCCYQVGDEVRQAFESDPDLIAVDRLNLWQANRRQLLAAGLLEDRIETLKQCSACTRDEQGAPRFFSHRADHGFTGRMMALVGIAADPVKGIG